MKLNKYYVAGVMELLGGFYLFDNKKRKDLHPRFKIVVNTSNEEKAVLLNEIILFLAQRYKIFLKGYPSRNGEYIVFQTTREDMLLKLIDYFKDNCVLKKNKQNEVKRYLLNRRKRRQKAKSEKVKRYEKSKELTNE